MIETNSQSADVGLGSAMLIFVKLMVSIPAGIFFVFLAHMAIGRLFLPVPESQWDTWGENWYVTKILLAEGFSIIGICLAVTIISMFRGNKDWFWPFAGLTIGSIMCTILACEFGIRG